MKQLHSGMKFISHLLVILVMAGGLLLINVVAYGLTVAGVVVVAYLLLRWVGVL